MMMMMMMMIMMMTTTMMMMMTTMMMMMAYLLVPGVVFGVHLLLHLGVVDHDVSETLERLRVVEGGAGLADPGEEVLPAGISTPSSS